MTRNSIRVAAALLAVGLAAPEARSERARPAPEALLESALAGPATAFQGRMMVTTWYGRQARAEEVEVYRSPPQLSRREFLAPDGSVERVIVSDGEREEVRLPRQGKVLRGGAVKSNEKLMSPERERALLLKNYELGASGPDRIAGRPAWILEIRPRAKGKPWQKLWIDQETRAILANRRYMPKRRFAALSRFTRFEPRRKLDKSLFALEQGSAPAAPGPPAPGFMTLEQLNEATGSRADFPSELPEGFVFESAAAFTVGRHTVRQARYTDGLAALSLFETDRPVRLPKDPSLVAGPKGARTLRLSSSVKVLSWKRGKRHFTLMGDLSRELLQAVSADLR